MTSAFCCLYDALNTDKDSIGLFTTPINSNNHEISTPDYFNGTVLKQGTDCGEAFLIQFDGGQIGFPDNNFDRTFYEINLDTSMRKEGLKLKIKFRDPSDGEGMFCTTLGLGFPQIFVLHAVKR